MAGVATQKIVTLLACERLCTTHLVEETGARRTNLSNHLKALREAGVVDTEPCGRFTYYKLRPVVFEQLAGSFTELAATAADGSEQHQARLPPESCWSLPRALRLAPFPCPETP